MSVLTPDNAPPRLIRYVSEDIYIGDTRMRAALDKKNNLLWVDKGLHDELPLWRQRQVERVTESLVYELVEDDKQEAA